MNCLPIKGTNNKKSVYKKINLEIKLRFNQNFSQWKQMNLISKSIR